jgi:hypothetical protein
MEFSTCSLLSEYILSQVSDGVSGSADGVIRKKISGIKKLLINIFMAPVKFG